VVLLSHKVVVVVHHTQEVEPEVKVDHKVKMEPEVKMDHEVDSHEKVLKPLSSSSHLDE
jgi:hypothetical protein